MPIIYKAAITIILIIWCIGIFIEFLVPYNEHLIYFLPYLNKTFSLVCHQENSKLITNGISETLTCARCTGIYLGLSLSSLIVLLKEPKIKISFKLILFAVIPMLIDIIFYSVQIYPYSKIFAFSTGSLLGSVGFLYFYSGFKNLIIEIKNK